MSRHARPLEKVDRRVIFEFRGTHRLILEILFHEQRCDVEYIVQASRLSRRFVQRIVERGLSCGLVRVLSAGEYTLSSAGCDLLGRTGGLLFDRTPEPAAPVASTGSAPCNS